jgi:hypothetical protein
MKPDRIEKRGGNGPEQPVWDDILTYSPEWYCRFREWHHEQFPDADAATRANLDMFVGFDPSADADIPDVHDDPSWGQESARRFDA